MPARTQAARPAATGVKRASAAALNRAQAARRKRQNRAQNTPLPSIEGLDAEPSQLPSPPPSAERSSSSIRAGQKRRREGRRLGGVNSDEPDGEGSPRRPKRRLRRKPDIWLDIGFEAKQFDATFDYDPNDVESLSKDAVLPWLARDPNTQEFLPVARGIQPDDIEEMIEIDKPTVASLEFPDVFDDEPKLVWRNVLTTKAVRIPVEKPRRVRRALKKGPKKANARAPKQKPRARNEYELVVSDLVQFDEDEDDAVQEEEEHEYVSAWEFQTKAEFFTKLPFEVRRKIYEELLVADGPVLVHSCWQNVYAREKPVIHTALLQTCQAIYAEAVQVLYGQNIFHYRIRDHLRRLPVREDLRSRAFGAGGESESESEAESEAEEDLEDNDDEYVEPLSQRATRRGRGNGGAISSSSRSRRNEVQRPTWDIKFDTFKCFYRNIVVEAESNRYEAGVQTRMAEAIASFNIQGKTTDLEGNESRLVLHTLTIRVTPTRTDFNGKYSFVDFFEKDSPVVKAIKDVDSRFLIIEICKNYLRSSLFQSYTSTRDSWERIVLDMRLQRIVYNVDDGGHNMCGGDSPGMAHLDSIRKGKLVELCGALDRLAEKVQQVCQSADVDFRPNVALGQQVVVDELAAEEQVEDDGLDTHAADSQQQYETAPEYLPPTQASLPAHIPANTVTIELEANEDSDDTSGAAADAQESALHQTINSAAPAVVGPINTVLESPVIASFVDLHIADIQNHARPRRASF